MLSALCTRRRPRWSPLLLLVVAAGFFVLQGLLFLSSRCLAPTAKHALRELPSRSLWQAWPPSTMTDAHAVDSLNATHSTVVVGIAPLPVRRWPPGHPKKRLFFTISTGHTGTMFLVRALRCGVNVTANHESAPAIVQFPSILRRGLKATYALRQAEKLAAFIEWVDSTGELPFADISHMTSKAWADVALDWLLRDERFEVTFIILRRHLIHVLRSMLLVDVWRPDSMLMYNGELTCAVDMCSGSHQAALSVDRRTSPLRV